MRALVPLTSIPLTMCFLSACATNAFDGPRTAPPEVVMGRSAAPAMPPLTFGTAGRHGDVIRLIDSRAIRALRAANNEISTLDLTREQKIAIWVGVGVVSAYLITHWIEDNVAFFP